MPDFAYIARDMTGQRVTGTLTAPTRQEAVATLGTRALFPLDVTVETSKAIKFGGRRISGQMMATTYGQLADLLRSGVPLLRSLELLSKQTSHQRLGEVLVSIKDQVSEGATLSDCMARHPKVFNEMATSMVRAGGEGGFLEEALDRVAEFTESQEDLKGRTMGAIAYPIFLAVVGTIVVTVLIVFFVPLLAESFDTLREKGELPAITEWLLALSNFLRGWGWLMLVLMAVGGFLFKSKIATDAGKFWLDKVKIRIPGAGPILLNLAVARFCRVLGTLLKNGVPILKSLDISSDAAGNRVLAQAVRDAAENISAGQSLAPPLAASKRFPSDIVEMIAVAEESNSLEQVLITIADGLERRTWRRLDLFVRLLEPFMLLLLAGAVMVVVLALLLPIIKMSTQV